MSGDLVDDMSAYMYAIALASDPLVQAVHDETPDRVPGLIRDVLRIQPPTGVNPITALVTVLAAQILPSLPVERRLVWVTAMGVRLAELEAAT